MLSATYFCFIKIVKLLGEEWPIISEKRYPTEIYEEKQSFARHRPTFPLGCEISRCNIILRNARNQTHLLQNTEHYTGTTVRWTLLDVSFILTSIASENRKFVSAVFRPSD